MSINLNLQSLSTCNQTSGLHLLPCKIDFDGDAKVSNYFVSSIRQEKKSDSESDLADKTASFRGRPLAGRAVTVPEGYTGLILKEEKRPFMEEDDRTLTISQKFDEYTYWNLDLATSGNDKVIRAMQWIDLANVLHAPVSGDGSQKSSPEK